MNDKMGYFMASIIITVIACFRYDIGWDYSNYFELVDRGDAVIMFEPLSSLIAWIAYISDNTYLFFIISGIIIYPLAFYSFKRFSKFPVVSLIVYIGFFFLSSCSIVRQALAVSFCLYSYKYILEKSFSKYFLCVFIAFLFHSSAIAALLIYPIYFILNFKLVFFILSSLLICKSILFSVLIKLGIYSEYLIDISEFNSGNLVKSFNLIVFLSFFIIIKGKHYNCEEKKMMSIVLVSIFTPYLFGSAIGERIGYYFLIYNCYLIPLLLKDKYIYKRIIYILVYSLYFLAMVYYSSNIKGQKSPYIPYKTIFYTDIDFSSNKNIQRDLIS